MSRKSAPSWQWCHSLSIKINLVMLRTSMATLSTASGSLQSPIGFARFGVNVNLEAWRLQHGEKVVPVSVILCAYRYTTVPPNSVSAKATGSWMQSLQQTILGGTASASPVKTAKRKMSVVPARRTRTMRTITCNYLKRETRRLLYLPRRRS